MKGIRWEVEGFTVFTLDPTVGKYDAGTHVTASPSDAGTRVLKSEATISGLRGGRLYFFKVPWGGEG
jgi:hypothetical protein